MSNNNLEEYSYYHIYNHAVGGRDLFKSPDNYEHFLRLMDRYILPIADVYSWVLMPNHFHLLIKTKGDLIYRYYLKELGNLDPDKKWATISNTSSSISTNEKQPKFESHFSHLFNSYAKYFNKINEYRGNLFERPFKRKVITNEKYLQLHDKNLDYCKIEHWLNQ